MQNDDIVFGGKRDKLMIKAIRRQNRRGVVGIGYHHQLGLLGYGRGDLVQIDEIPVFRTLRHRIQRGARQARPIGKDGVAGIWHEDNVAWVYDGKRDMRQPFLGAQKRDDFGGRVQRYAVAAQIPGGYGLAECLGIAQGIEIVFRHKRFTAERLHDMRGGGNVGRADGEIHHRQALGNPLGAHLGQLTEDTDAKGIHSVGKLQGIFTSYWV